MTYHMKKKEVMRFLVFRTLGNFFILLTIFGFFATFGPAIYFEGRYRIAQASGVEFQVHPAAQEDSELGKLLRKTREENIEATGDQDSLLGTIIKGDKEQILAVKSSEFSLIIPKIGASEVVTPNVDPSNTKEYTEALKKSIAHAKGSAFPGLNGNTYIFAHSADSFWNVGRYNAVFYLLKELSPGDEVIVIFQGKRFNYVVSETKVVDATDVSYINANLGAGETLTLQTCWPPGTTWKRLLVFAKPS
jgi:LPXTG-site transpeptidase (sortase) family protein